MSTIFYNLEARSKNIFSKLIRLYEEKKRTPHGAQDLHFRAAVL